jgi:hypothetical protein
MLARAPLVALGTSVALLACADYLAISSSGSIRITLSTSGSAPQPDGYRIIVDRREVRAVAANGAVTLTGVSAGTHSVALEGLVSNCVVSGPNPRRVTVGSDGTANLVFLVSCGPSP